MSINHIQLTDFTVAEWYKKDALLPSSTGPLPKGPVPAPGSAPPGASASAATSPSPTAPGTPITATTTPAAPAREVPKADPAPEAPKAEAPQAPAPQAPGEVSPKVAPPQTAPHQTAPPETPQTPTYKYLGNNRRHITLLVHSPGSGFLPENQLTFLIKILEACRMNLADVAIVNNAVVPATITALRQQLQPKTILLFGVDPTAIRLPINFPHFKQLNYDDCTYLSSPALDQLVPNTEDSKLLKSKLWVSLKTLFDV